MSVLTDYRECVIEQRWGVISVTFPRITFRINCTCQNNFDPIYFLVLLEYMGCPRFGHAFRPILFIYFFMTKIEFFTRQRPYVMNKQYFYSNRMSSTFNFINALIYCCTYFFFTHMDARTHTRTRMHAGTHTQTHTHTGAVIHKICKIDLHV